jgi:transposase
MSDDSRPTEEHPPATERRTTTAQERLLLLDLWQRSGLTAREFGALVGVSKVTLFSWKQRFEHGGPAALHDEPRGAPRGSRLPDPTQRAILLMKRSHPEWGCERIREVLLRGEGYSASVGAIAHVLRGAGYESEDVDTTPHPAPVHYFERARPNQLWHVSAHVEPREFERVST